MAPVFWVACLGLGGELAHLLHAVGHLSLFQTCLSKEKSSKSSIPLEGGNVSMLSKEKKCLQVTSARTWLPLATPA